MIKLNADKSKDCFDEQKVVYDEREMGFMCLKCAPVCVSLLLAYIEIQFDGEDMCAKEISGLSPKGTWKKARLAKPENVLKGALKLEENFEWGVYRLDADDGWETFYDEESGWVCVGEPDSAADGSNINFISNAIATIDKKGELKALWIKLI